MDEQQFEEFTDELRVAVARLSRRLREAAYPRDLSWAQVSALRHIEREGPQTVSSLARLEGVRPQSMGATVAALEAAGFLEGTPDPDDGRQTIWSVTADARVQLDAERAARQDWLLRRVRAELSADEADRLAAVVPLLRRLAE
ncbi:MarR family winged helix-turn-helix transcriptional regulator [Protaetiibacter larvae]|uniref:MarR family transcriptional regulator n=1 Tax=Protaetiibacter larvae TaxID=2592654 RepID=A0A5C1Y5X9_9MICO|nr:MarR family transcriptional regulator [Protaetiibacter larvae]QEO09443.1 MarR family transcriptional regulator [Protaetiibacter larvae]